MAKVINIPYKETKFGFDWGAAEITRVASIGEDGSVVVSIETPKETLYVRITKTGLICTGKISKG